MPACSKLMPCCGSTWRLSAVSAATWPCDKLGPHHCYALSWQVPKAAFAPLPSGLLYRIDWPDIGLSDLVNITRANLPDFRL
jgi:hypothetical protein